jgi:hypothetical protein
MPDIAWLIISGYTVTSVLVQPSSFGEDVNVNVWDLRTWNMIAEPPEQCQYTEASLPCNIALLSIHNK